MARINLPKEILQKDAFRSLAAKGKDEYLSNLLKKILDLNPEGVTISQIRESTGFTYSTIWHHLEVLSSSSQGRKVTRGNLDIYFPYGKLEHIEDFRRGDTFYSISLGEGPQGKFVCIYEKKEQTQDDFKVCSGVSFPLELLDKIVASLNKIKK